MRDGQELALSVRQLLESVFMRLFHGGGCAVQDVGAHFGITSAAASQLAEKLVQAGLVKDSIEERYRWVSEALPVLQSALVQPEERTPA